MKRHHALLPETAVTCHHALLPETAGVMASQGMMALQRHSGEVVATPMYPRCAGIKDMPHMLDNASPYFPGRNQRQQRIRKITNRIRIGLLLHSLLSARLAHSDCWVVPPL